MLGVGPGGPWLPYNRRQNPAKFCPQESHPSGLRRLESKGYSPESLSQQQGDKGGRVEMKKPERKKREGGGEMGRRRKESQEHEGKKGADWAGSPRKASWRR